jgi:hypothetical protein
MADQTIPLAADPITGQQYNNDISAMLGPQIARANQSLPEQYQATYEAKEPRLPTINKKEPMNEESRPITSSVYDIKHARRQNAFHTAMNGIAAAGQAIAERKQDRLKGTISDVMKAQNNIANANKILNDPAQSDGAKKMAQGILGANNKKLQDLFSDPKTQKQLAKAFDISYTDPQKNKKPEVKAAFEAYQEFQKSGQYKYDDPKEAAVANIANGGSNSLKPGNLAINMPPPPELKFTKMDPKASKEFYKEKDAHEIGSQIADKLLSSMVPSIEGNPNYAQAVKEKQDAWKDLDKSLTTMIKTEQEAYLKGKLQSQKIQNDIELQKLKGNNTLEAADLRGQYELQNTLLLNKARIKVAQIDSAARLQAAKYLSDPKIKFEQYKIVYDNATKQINDLENLKNKYLTDLENDKKSNKPSKNKQTSLQAAIDQTNRDITNTQQTIDYTKSQLLPVDPAIDVYNKVMSGMDNK